MGGIGSKQETSATVISNLIASITQKTITGCTTDITGEQAVKIHDCTGVVISGVNQTQYINVDIECIIKAVSEAVESQSLAQTIIAEAQKLNIGLASEITNLLKVGEFQKAYSYINTTLKEEVTNVTVDQVKNNIALTQKLGLANCSDITISDLSQTQTVEGTISSIIASTDLSKILQNVNQKVTVSDSSTTKDFDFLLLIGGIIFIVLVLILIAYLVTRGGSKSKSS